MAQPLPRLRLDLEFMPSPDPERPGLLIRDPMGYSDMVLIVPPPLVPCLACFDGDQSDLDLRQELVRITGEFDISALQQQMSDALSQAGFLHDERGEAQREEKRQLFANSEFRLPAHAGTAYPDTREELTLMCDEYVGSAAPVAAGAMRGIAAPHVSPEGGWECYQAAYRALKASRDQTFVILGTSHYGEPDRFGLTRKGFSTPFGNTRPALKLIDELASRAEPAVTMEDYCHSVEHSIEFQVIFLQHLFGPDVEILPVLCGSFARSIYEGGKPEDSEQVKQFLDVLGDIAAREGNRLTWVLGVDMAHMGSRYQDDLIAEANSGPMLEVARRDHARMSSINLGDARAYWDQVQQNRDDLKWCGSSPFYTFMQTNPTARGTTLRYDQWNIDEESVVSFAGMAFH